MLLTYMRMIVGAALCIYATVLFLIDLPQVVLVGPFVLLMLGIFLLVGPGRALRAGTARRTRYQSYLAENPTAQRSEVRATWLERIGYAVFAFGVLCWVFGAGSHNWVWIALAALGLGTGLYRDIVAILGQHRASR